MELATAGLNLVLSQRLNCNDDVWLNKLPEGRPIDIRVGIFEQAGTNLTSAQIHVVNCDVLVFEKLVRTYTYQPPVYRALPYPVFLTWVRVDLG